MKVFTIYVDMLSYIFRMQRRPGACELNLSHLDSIVRRFKGTSYEVFSPYQSSSMGTNKFHSLVYIGSDLRDTGVVYYMHAGRYESSHKDLTEYFRIKSKRKDSAM